MEKSIAFMFDIGGTIGGIEDNEVEELFKRIEILRQKFEAEKAYITISTHFEDSEEIQFIARRLAPHLNDHIVFGPHFYYYGKYDYDENKSTYIDSEFNRDKMKVFYDYYVNQLGNNEFLACFDDSFNRYDYLEYQDKHPLLCGVPKSFGQYVKPENNTMMFIVSSERFTKGIIDVLDNYIAITKDIRKEDIVEAQKHMDIKLDEIMTEDLIIRRKLHPIVNFLLNGNPVTENYGLILHHLLRKYSDPNISEEERNYLNQIIPILYNYYESINNEYGIEDVRKLQKIFKEEPNL